MGPMIRFKGLLLLLMVTEKISGIRNCRIILTMKGVLGQTGERLWGKNQASQAERVFSHILVLQPLSTYIQYFSSFISLSRFTHRKSFSSHAVCIHWKHCSFMIYLIFSLTGISWARLPVLRVLTYIQFPFAILTAFKPLLSKQCSKHSQLCI